MYSFELINDEVVCKDLAFKLQKIEAIKPEQMPNEINHHPGDMIMEANLSSGEKLLFLIDPKNDPDFKYWSMELFYKAVEYYCQCVKDQEAYSIGEVYFTAFYPYDGSTDFVQ